MPCYGQFEIVKYLIDGQTPMYGMVQAGSPAQVAAQAGKWEVVRLLAEYNGRGT